MSLTSFAPLVAADMDRIVAAAAMSANTPTLAIALTNRIGNAYARNAATPGSSRPSSNSKLAPPPVDTWSI